MSELLEMFREGDDNTVYLLMGSILGVIWFVGVIIHTFINYNTINTTDVMLKLTGGTIGIIWFGPILVFLGLFVLVFYLLKFLFLDLVINFIKFAKYSKESRKSTYKVFDRE